MQYLQRPPARMSALKNHHWVGEQKNAVKEKVQSIAKLNAKASTAAANAKQRVAIMPNKLEDVKKIELLKLKVLQMVL